MKVCLERRRSILLGLLLLCACAAKGSPYTVGVAELAAFPAEASISTMGWLSHSGEFQLYDSKASMQSRGQFPTCVSGVFPRQSRPDLSKFEGRKVEIKGKLVDYERLQLENRILPRRILSGSVVSNFCFGPFIILASTIRTVE
jgi:hypothetical protein